MFSEGEIFLQEYFGICYRAGVNREAWEVPNRNPICSDYFQIKISTETCLEWEAESAVPKERFQRCGGGEGD